MANVYDFYKPHLASEYPEVDGPLTQTCYPGALEQSYDHFRLKDAKRLAKLAGKEASLADVTLEDFDFLAFHSPYGKLVQKGFARLVRSFVFRRSPSSPVLLTHSSILLAASYFLPQLYNDYLSNPTAARFESIDPALALLPRSETILNKDIEKAFVALSKSLFAAKSLPTMLTSKKLGNMYSASLYGALASLLDATPSEALQGKRIGMFSYGSGLAASFFTLRVAGSTQKMQKELNLQERLSKMQVRSCEEYVKALEVTLVSFLSSSSRFSLYRSFIR